MVVQQHRLRGGAVAVTAVVGLLASTAGCSGDGGAVAEDRQSGDPVDVVHRAAEVLAGAGSSRTRTSMEMAAGGTRVTIRGEGTYNFRERMGQLKVQLPQDPAGVDEHRPITELLSPGALYMKNRGAGVPVDKWVRIDAATLDDGNLVTGGATDPLVAAELLRGASTVTYEGRTELAGGSARHYRGVADIGRAARAASPQVRGALAAAAKGFARDAVPFDAYLDDQGRLLKVRHRFSYINSGRAVAVASTTVLYAFGTPILVRLPAERDIFAGKIES
ncbi:hypothetical protein ABCR94_30210 [Streptomyces sp. 21So2-11]|uniref:hypothetical protein n=1 Tax=Streptomyces sp. 21So2-11 TaxID=3144408 RepID=UPI00321AB893